MRYATVIGASLTREQLERYLPSNYTVFGEDASNGERQMNTFTIAGEDRAGWTLDDYVIPRLGSGLIFATEVDRASL